MKAINLTQKESRVLVALAVFGFLVPNGIFLYLLFSNLEMARDAFTNPISIVFIAEAFYLMFLFAWLLKKAEVRKPTGLLFIIMSLIGSMAFSVPASIYLIFKKEGRK